MHFRTLLALIAMPLSFAAAQSQSDMNLDALKTARRADATLNALYRQLETAYRVDSVALRKLRVAQRAWVKFRDAQLDATYPAVDQGQAYGSVFPMCFDDQYVTLTKARIAQLQLALKPAKGDVCSGGPGLVPDPEL